MQKYCCAGGQIVELAKTRVAPNDLAVLRGYGCFDFLKTVNGRPLLWPEHWRRFQNSAKLLNLKIPVGEREVLQIIEKLRNKNKLSKSENFSLRLLLTGDNQLFVLLEELYIYPPKVFKNGAKLISREYQRAFPVAKSTNYLNAIYWQKDKKKAGALEILYHANGQILECSTSNFFLVKNGRLITAKDNILLGVTRNKVLELAKKEGIEVEERGVVLQVQYILIIA